MSRFASPLELYRALRQAWAADTASPTGAWSAERPARNHCSVTALIVHDHFGGEILCTRTSGGTHFYNRIDGRMWDLTAGQFAEPVPYEDTPASRETALCDTSGDKYRLLSARLAALGGA